MVQSFMYSNTIGAYYNNAVEQVMSPGKGPDGSDGYYIADADGSMDCATLKTNFDKLDNQIQYWYGILQGGNNNSTELQNLNKIINVQRTKKDYYAELMLRNCSTVPQTTDEGTPTIPPSYDPAAAPDENKGGIMTFITANPLATAAIIAALIVAITYWNKKPQRKKRRKAA